MQPIVFLSAVGRLFPSQLHSAFSFDTSRIEQQLRSDKAHERAQALGALGASLKTADITDIVRLIAVALQNTDDKRVIVGSINTLDKLIEARTLSPNYEADQDSPIGQAIQRLRDWWRRLQMKRITRTLESNVDLRASLIGLMQHEDSKIRRRVVAGLYLANSPSRSFESFMHRHYQSEHDPSVRANIIRGLTMHKYTSGVTIDVYRQALKDPSMGVRRAAQRGIDALEKFSR